jgi:predicted ester cyclase
VGGPPPTSWPTAVNGELHLLELVVDCEGRGTPPQGRDTGSCGKACSASLAAIYAERLDVHRGLGDHRVVVGCELLASSRVIAEQGSATMSTDDPKVIARRFFEAFETNDQAALTAILAPELKAYLPGDPEPISRQAMLDTIQRWDTAFSGLHFTIERQVAEGDLVAVQVTLRGVHDRGDFLDIPPTGNRFEISVITIERVSEGRIVERRVSLDPLDLMQQLGAMGTPEPTDGA